MIDAVAKALARWAAPVNDWDALAEEQREAWRDAARVAETAREPLEDQINLVATRLAVYHGDGEISGSNPFYLDMARAALTPADG